MGKGQLWKEFWSDVFEICREFSGSQQPVFNHQFERHGIQKRYIELINLNSHLTSVILHQARIKGKRLMQSFEIVLQNGRKARIWKLEDHLLIRERNRVDKELRLLAREVMGQSNRQRKSIRAQINNILQLPLFDLTLFDNAQSQQP